MYYCGSPTVSRLAVQSAALGAADLLSPWPLFLAGSRIDSARSTAGRGRIGLAAVFVFVAVALLTPHARAQEIRVSGSALSEGHGGPPREAPTLGGRATLGVAAGRLFDLYGGVGLEPVASAQLGTRLRQWRSWRLEPFLEAGYARYPLSRTHTSTMHVGAGLQYDLTGRLGVHLQFGRRIDALEHPPGARAAAPPPPEGAWTGRAGLFLQVGGRRPAAWAGPPGASPGPNERGFAAGRSPGPMLWRPVLQVSAAAVSSGQSPAQGETRLPGGRLSIGVPVSPLFDFTGAVGLDPDVSLQLGARLRPLRRWRTEPYLEASYERYVRSPERTAAAALGAGLRYRLTERAGLFVEAERRVLASEHPAGRSAAAPPRADWSWRPRAGISIDLRRRRSRGGRPAPPRPEPPDALFDSPVDSPGAAPLALAEPAHAGAGSHSSGPASAPGPAEAPTAIFEEVLVTGLLPEVALPEAALPEADASEAPDRKRFSSAEAFYIDAFEVTNAEYRSYLEGLPPEARAAAEPGLSAWREAGSRESWGQFYLESFLFGNYPVVGVRWEQARSYCRAQDGRLPTETEWEYAARARHMRGPTPGEAFRLQDSEGRPRGNYRARADVSADRHAFTAPVGRFPPNDWGVYDMIGNVAEWTRDAVSSPEGPGKVRPVVRGGSWASPPSVFAEGARSTRPSGAPSIEVGFRCVRELEPSAEGEAAGVPPPERR